LNKITEVKMSLKQFVLNSFDRQYQALKRAVNGLTYEEITFRPNPHSNSIGFLVWHYGRALDMWFQSGVKGEAQLWESQGWAEKFNRAPANPRDVGFGFNEEQLAAFDAPSIELLLDYAEASRANAMGYIEGLDDADLEKVVVNNPIAAHGGELPLVTMCEMLIWEVNQHGGQMAYLRGLQKGINA
jgi:hypothetical protein